MWGCSARRQEGSTLSAWSLVEGGPLVRLSLSVWFVTGVRARLVAVRWLCDLSRLWV